MRRHQHRGRNLSPVFNSDSDSDPHFRGDEEDEDDDAEEVSAAGRRWRRRMKMKCLSCKEDYDGDRDVGTCRECYEEAGETEEDFKREIEDLKSKVNFLRLLSVGPGPAGPNSIIRPNTSCFYDVVLVASGSTDSPDSPCSSPSIRAHRAVLTSRSPVFRAMLENEMEESLSGTIKISDVSYDVLRLFVNYLYTAEACLDEHMACGLLVVAEKYQVMHLKTYCEKFLLSRLKWENSLPYYAFAHQHGAKGLLEAALSLIMDNMDKLSKQEEYMELVEKDPRAVVEIYEVYLSRQVNTAAGKDPGPKT